MRGEGVSEEGGRGGTHLAGGPDPAAHKQYDQHPGEQQAETEMPADLAQITDVVFVMHPHQLQPATPGGATVQRVFISSRLLVTNFDKI